MVVFVKAKQLGIMTKLKGSLIALAAALLLVGQEASAQLYFTGGLGAGVTSASKKTHGVNTLLTVQEEHTTISDGASSLGEFFPSAKEGLRASFAVNFGIGYGFSEKLGAGVTLGYLMLRQGGSNYAKESVNGIEIVTKGRNTTTVHAATLTPYLRYTPVNLSGFKIYMDCGVPMEFGTVGDYSKSESSGTVIETKTKPGSVFNVGVGVTPGVAYSFTDNISVYANLRFLHIGYSYMQFSQNKELLPLFTDQHVERFHQFNFGKLSDGMEIGICFSL